MSGNATSPPPADSVRAGPSLPSWSRWPGALVVVACVWACQATPPQQHARREHLQYHDDRCDSAEPAAEAELYDAGRATDARTEDTPRSDAQTDTPDRRRARRVPPPKDVETQNLEEFADELDAPPQRAQHQDMHGEFASLDPMSSPPQ